MATRENILKSVQEMKNTGCSDPIYEVFLIKYSEDTKQKNYPNISCTDSAGFYYDIDKAIEAMHTNRLDIQECLFNTGFVLCRFEGLYNVVDKDFRIYFAWNREKEGFFEQEEPEIFKHSVY